MQFVKNIDAPRDRVFSYLNNLENHNIQLNGQAEDSTIQHIYQGSKMGFGAKKRISFPEGSWMEQRSRNLILTVVESRKPFQVQTELSVEGILIVSSDYVLNLADQDSSQTELSFLYRIHGGESITNRYLALFLSFKANQNIVQANLDSLILSIEHFSKRNRDSQSDLEVQGKLETSQEDSAKVLGHENLLDQDNK